MDLAEIRNFLLWCTVINYSILLLWFAVFSAGRNWLRRFHSRWFKLGSEHFDVVHYAGMTIYKIGVLLFNLVPLLALYLVS